MSAKLLRYIKTKTGEKTEMRTTSLNLELRHIEFLKKHDLNLSLMVREFLDNLLENSELLSEKNVETVSK